MIFCRACWEPITKGDLVVPVLEAADDAVPFKAEAYAHLSCVKNEDEEQ